MTKLAPITARRLTEFRRRRNTLLTARGLSAGLLVLIGTALLLVPIDAIWTLPDMMRYILAGAIYLATAVVVFLLAIRPWIRGRSISWLAGLFEKSDPRLKNRLLAAVELSNEVPSNKPSLDSAEFRESVQRDVAKILESVPVSHALPWRLIGRWLLLSITLMASVAVLCAFPQLHLSNRLSRILFPMANLGRISQFAVTILNPSPSSCTLPEDEVVAIVANIRNSGFEGSPKDVALEVRSSDSKLQRVAMRKDKSDLSVAPETDGEVFQTNWNVSSGVTEYRVVADDSASGWYQLRGAPRPKIDAFEIEYRYPSYAGLDPEKFTSMAGNLEAIEGTNAQVAIRVNQPIASAVLRIAPKSRGLRIQPKLNATSTSTISKETPTTESRIEFHRVAGSELFVAEVPMNESGSYRVELAALETKFTNSFAPTYTIRAIPDREPKIAWKFPRESTISVTPESLVELALQTEDELPIASLVQQLRSGTHEWSEQGNVVSQMTIDVQDSRGETKPLSTVVRALSIRQSLDTVFDLAMNRVSIGETLQMRWIATDRKGQKVTSPILEMFVASASLDPKRRERMMDRLTVTREMEKVRDVFASQTEAMKKAKEAFESDRDNPEKQSALATAAKEFVAKSKKSMEELDKTIVETMPKLKDSVSAEEFDRISQVVEQVRAEQLREVDNLSEQALDTKNPRQAAEKMIDAINKANETVNLAARRSNEFTGHDVLSQIGQDISTMQRYQQELKDSVDKMLPEQFRRRQAIVARHLSELAEMTREQSKMLRDGAKQPAVQWAEWMENQATTIRAVTGTEDRPKIAQDSETERKQLAERLEVELRNHQLANNIDGGLHDETRNGRNDLRDRTPKPAKLIENLAEEVTKSATKPGDSEDIQKGAKEAKENVEKLLVPALDQIAHQRTTQQARNDSDGQWIADLGDSYRAANAIATNASLDANEKGQQLKEVAQAIKKLEAVHELQQASRTLDEMQSTERWKGLSFDAKFEQPRQLDAWKQRLDRAVNALREAGFSNEITGKLDQMKWNETANKIDQKIGPRRWSNEPWMNASEDLQAMQKSIREEAKKIEEAAKEARMNLAEMAPTVSDLARQASKSLEQGIAPTESLAKAIGEGTVPDRVARINQVDDKLAEVKQPMQSLREALSDMASRQDLMKSGLSRLARDADAASGITQQAEQRIEESITAARKAENDRDAQDAVQQSANTQRDATEALAMIAEHFDALSKAAKEGALAGEPEDKNELANSLAGALADAVAKMPSSDTLASAKDNSLNATHEEADRLRKLSSSNPERVLAQLEKELPRNPQMQRELSKIARSAVDDSLKTLDYSAKKEQTLRVDLENSDDEYREEKEQLRQAIQQSAEIASRMSDTMLPRVRTTAERGEQQPISAEVAKTQNDLLASADASRNTNADQPMETIAATAKSLGRSIEQAKREMSQQALKLEKASSGNALADENQQKNRRREMEDWQRNYRNQDINHAQQIENQSNQAMQRAEQKLNESRQSVEQRQQEANEAKRQVEEKPDDAGRIAQAEQKAAGLERAQQSEAKAESKRQESQARYEGAKARREKLQSDQPGELTANSPPLELGFKVAASAAEQAKIASDLLREALADAGQSGKENGEQAPSSGQRQASGPNASQDKLKGMIEQQDALKQGVQEASQSIARAARHESRMQNIAVGETLMKQANDIDAVAKGEMEQARENLSQAVKDSSNQPSKLNKQVASIEASVESMKGLASAKQAIEKAAEGLQGASSSQATNQRNASGKAGSSQASTDSASAKQPSSGEGKNPSRGLLSPQEMARMLDELDQQLAKAKAAQSNDMQSNDMQSNDMQSNDLQSKSKAGEGETTAEGSAKGKSSDNISSESSSDAAERAATLAEATRRLAASMNQQRRESESAIKQSSVAATQPSNSRAVSRAGNSSDAVVLASESGEDGDWGRLREQSAEESADTVREGIAPAYRKQVDDYFKILSTRREHSQ